MKQLLFFLVCITSVVSRAQQEYPCPPNGNAESNNHSNWTTLRSVAQNPQSLNDFTYGFDTTLFNVFTDTSTFGPVDPQLVNGVDQYGLFSVPSEGTYCFALGNNETGGRAQIMQYTFTVTNQNKDFKLRYAIVLQDGGHSGGENPAAWMYMVTGTDHIPGLSSMGLFSSTRQTFIADLGDPFYKQSTVRDDVIYRDWECLEYDLSNYVGQQVTFVVMSRDCVPTGHFGYIYVDGLCTAWPAIADGALNSEEYCLEQTIMLNAASSEGEDSYFLEVSEVDETGNYLSGGMVDDWYIAKQAPDNINISDYLAEKGVTLECGGKYKVKVAVVNGCAPWNEKNMFFRITCPSANAGPDITQCCEGEGTETDGWEIGPAGIPGSSYKWESVPSGLFSDQPQITVNPTTSTAYLLTVNQPNGCIARDTVIVRFLPSDYLMSLVTDYNLCNNRPIVTAHLAYLGCPKLDSTFLSTFGYPDASFIKWFFDPAEGDSYYLGQGGSIQAPNAENSGELMATIATECTPGEFTTTTATYYRPGGSGLIAPNSFTPDPPDGINDTFIVQEFGPYAPENIGDGPAYGIEDFNLRIWNRWGENFRTMTKADAGRGPNDYVRQGDIFWDGKDTDGIVQWGTYVWTLEVKYCGSDKYQRVCIDGMETDFCFQGFLWWCNNELEGCAGMVNVID